MIKDPKELKQLTAFFAWAAWASVVNRPGKTFSYTNNFPYDPLAGNVPSSDAYLWSALSIIALWRGPPSSSSLSANSISLAGKGEGTIFIPR